MADHVVLWWLLAASPEWHEDVGADARCRSAAGALVTAHAAAAAARATFTADDLGARHNAWPVAVATASSVHAFFATVLAWPTGLGLALAGVGATALLAGTRCCLERFLESLVKRVNRRARTDSPLGLSLARPRLLRVLAIVLASATASAMLALSAMLFAPVPSEGEPALPLLFLPLMLLVGALCLAVRPISWLLVALFDAQAPPHHLAIARIVIFGCWWWDMAVSPMELAMALHHPCHSSACDAVVHLDPWPHMWSTQGLPRELLDFAGGATIGGNLSWVSSTNFILAPRLDSGEPSTGAIGAAATRLAIVSAMASAGALCWLSLPLAAVLALHFITLINAASLHLSHGPNAPLVASFVLALAGARAGDAWSIDALVRRHWPSRASWRRERIFSAGIPYKAAAGRDHGLGGDPSTRPSSEPAWYRPFIWRAAPALALLAVGFQYTNGGYPKLGSSPLLPHGGWTTDRNLVHSGLVIWYRETILHLDTGYPLNYLTPRLPVLHDMLQEYTTLAAAPSLLAEHFAPVLFVGPGKLRVFTGMFFACFHSSIEMLMYIRHFRTTMCIVLALGLPAWWLRTPASDRGYARTGNAIDEESGQEGRGNNSTGVEDEHLRPHGGVLVTSAPAGVTNM
eukprot:PRCOL_00000143-RA